MKNFIIKSIHLIISLISMCLIALVGIKYGYDIYQSELDWIYKSIIILLIAFAISLLPIFFSILYEYLLSFVGLKIDFKNPFKEFNKRTDKLLSRMSELKNK